MNQLEVMVAEPGGDVLAPVSFAGVVSRGAGWLDATFPGWERHIDVGRLRMQNDEHCVLGQLVGRVTVPTSVIPTSWWSDFYPTDTLLSGYGAVKFALSCGPGEVPAAHVWMVEHGFTRGLGDWRRWVELTDGWTELIKERFSSGALSDN